MFLRCTPGFLSASHTCTPGQFELHTSSTCRYYISLHSRHGSRFTSLALHPRSSLGFSFSSALRHHDDTRWRGGSGFGRGARRRPAGPLSCWITVGIAIRARSVYGSIFPRRRPKWRSWRFHGPPAEDDSRSGNHVEADGTVDPIDGPLRRHKAISNTQVPFRHACGGSAEGRARNGPAL